MDTRKQNRLVVQGELARVAQLYDFDIVEDAVGFTVVYLTDAYDEEARRNFEQLVLDPIIRNDTLTGRAIDVMYYWSNDEPDKVSFALTLNFNP